MATLRAAAYLINGALLLFALIMFAKDFPKAEPEVLIAILVTSAPMISIITIALLSRQQRNP